MNGFELVDTLGDPERPISNAQIVAKMRSLAHWGGLSPHESERATTIALQGEDAGALDAMLAEWTA